MTAVPYHTVNQGEHIMRIAADHGFVDYHAIWDHPDNAELKQKRENPHILHPGDRLFVPEKEAREEQGATEKRHRFRYHGHNLKLRLRLLDYDEQPLANLDCELHIEGVAVPLTTDGDGFIEHAVAESDEDAFLSYKDPESGLQVGIPVKIGHLDPVAVESGQRARLNNLGYEAGPVEGGDPQKLAMAIEEFQCDHDLKVTGKCDSQTQARLKEIHGC